MNSWIFCSWGSYCTFYFITFIYKICEVAALSVSLQTDCPSRTELSLFYPYCFFFHDFNNKEMFCGRFWTSFTTVPSAAVPLMKHSPSFTLKAFWRWLLIRKCSADIVGHCQVDLQDAFIKHHWSEFGFVCLWYITVGSITEMSNLSQIRTGNFWLHLIPSMLFHCVYWLLYWNWRLFSGLNGKTNTFPAQNVNQILFPTYLPLTAIFNYLFLLL